MYGKVILMGSRALEMLSEEFKCGPKSDWDVICEPGRFAHIPNVEEHDVNKPLNAMIYDLLILNDYIFERHYCNHLKINVYVPKLQVQAAIKRSHLYRDLGFSKHMVQYNRHLKDHMTGIWKDWALERAKMTRKEYPRSNPNLKQSNEDFFDDNVTKVYDHDDIHEIAAYYDRPLYTRLKHNDKTNSAWCEKDLWEEFNYGDKLKCVCEETYVISCERFLVPRNWEFPTKLAYIKSLEKVCTTLTSGWFRDFAIDNFDEIYAMYSETKFAELKAGITELEKVHEAA